MIVTKFDAAVSDTDILIDLYRTDTLELLRVLFNKIIIPEYIFQREIPKAANKFKDTTGWGLKEYISNNPDYILVVADKDMPADVRMLKKKIKADTNIDIMAGRGEVECVTYALASGINIVVSNNITEFNYLNTPWAPVINTYAIMVNYYHILTIAVLHGKLTKEEAKVYYDKIRVVKNSDVSFDSKIKESVEYFKESSYVKALNLEGLV